MLVTFSCDCWFIICADVVLCLFLLFVCFVFWLFGLVGGLCWLN